MQEGEKVDKIWNHVLMFVLEKRKESFRNKVVCEDDAMIDELELSGDDEAEFVNLHYHNSSATNDEISGIQSNNSFINDDMI